MSGCASHRYLRALQPSPSIRGAACEPFPRAGQLLYRLRERLKRPREELDKPREGFKMSREELHRAREELKRPRERGLYLGSTHLRRRVAITPPSAKIATDDGAGTAPLNRLMNIS